MFFLPILIAYHFFWTELHIFPIRIILKMIPITYWTYQKPNEFNIFAWLGDLVLLFDGNIPLLLGLNFFIDAHMSRMQIDQHSWKMLLISFPFIIFGAPEPMMVYYALILIWEMWKKPSIGLGLMILSDILIGINLIRPFQWADTLTLGTYWMGMWMLN